MSTPQQRQVVEKCAGDHAHVVIQFIYTDMSACMIITTNEEDTTRVIEHALRDPHVTQIYGGDHTIYLN